MIKKMMVVFCSLLLLIGMPKTDALAVSAMLTFSTEVPEVAVGSDFTVLLTVSSSKAITGVDTYISYDAAVMQFVSGGQYISGDAGLLHVTLAGLKDKAKSVKFALQFKAIAPGGCAISITDQAKVTDADSKEMSVSSNRLSITATGEALSPTDPAIAVESLSTNNNLAALKIHTGKLEPLFEEGVTEYTVGVDFETDILYFSTQASDPGAITTILGNEGLKEGKNEVKVSVKAPNGDEKIYKVTVNKENEEQTQERLEKEQGTEDSGIAFKVYAEDNSIFLENAYRYQIIELEDETLLPAGYVKTKVVLYGVSITAYTIENDLDNDYLLIYAMNDKEEKDFYQYDRVEKSMQRYTGDLIEKVNLNATDSKIKNADEYNSNLTQLAIIIAILVAFCVFMLIAMIKMLLKFRGIDDNDELNL